MKSNPNSVGVFTTDRNLVVQVWDSTLVGFTGIESTAASGRHLATIITDIESRGLTKYFYRVLQEGVAQVLAPAFHKYLVRCAPTKPSKHSEYMRQRVTIAPLEEGAGVAGLIVTVEDVTARHDRERELMTPGAQLSDADSWIAALDDESWRVRGVAVEQIPSRIAPDAIAALLRSVRDNHHSLGLLNSALTVLARSNIDTHETLVEFLKGHDVDLRIQAALALGGQNDSRAIPPLLEALRDPSPNVCYHAIEALGALKAIEASDMLSSIAETRDFFLAFPALEALGAIGDSRVAPRIVPLLQDNMLQDAAAHALAKIGDESAVEPLVRLLNAADAPTEAIASSLAILYDRYEQVFGEGRHIAELCASFTNATGTQNLIDALSRGSIENLRPLILVLGWLESLAGARALTLHLGSPDLRNEIIEAFVRHGSKIIDVLLEQLNSEDLGVRWAAVIALGRIRDNRATPVLANMLATDEELTIPIVAALAAIGDSRAVESLFALIGKSDAAIRRAAVSALNSLAAPGMVERVHALLNDPNPAKREAATRIAGYFGYRECVDSMFLRCEDEDESVRRAAIEHLPYLDDDRALEVLKKTLVQGSASVRAIAATALGHLDSAKAIPALINALHDENPWVRYFAIRALGRHRASEAASLLRQLTSDKSQQVRIAAFEALLRVDEEASVIVANTFLSSTELDLQQAVAAGVGQLAHKKATLLLVEALRSPYSSVRATAAAALGGSADPLAFDALRGAAEMDRAPEVIGAALFGLKKLATPEATRALIDLLNDPLRRDMAKAALADPEILHTDILIWGLKHPSSSVRLALVGVFEKLKRPESAELLRVALNDADTRVSVAAASALTRNRRHQPVGVTESVGPSKTNAN